MKIGKYFKIYRNTLIFSVIFLTLLSLNFSDLSAQRYRIQKGPEKVYKDEYSDLDDRRHRNPARDKQIKDIIDKSKQQYFQGLILIERGDTASAVTYFENAIEQINILVSYPEIVNDESFIDISQALIEDYEMFFSNTKYLNEDSPIFIVKELIYSEGSISIDNFSALDTLEFDDEYLEYEDEEDFDKIVSGFRTLPDSIQIPLEMNEFVEKNIEFLTTKHGRRFFARWLARSTKWFPMMSRIANDIGVPQDILYLSMIESALLPHAVSPAKAVGLWQFIRSTGKMYGLNANESYWIDERRDPEKATRAAIRHLKDLYTEFGDWYLVLSAYNCGPGCVQRAIRRSRIQNPTYWEIRRFLPRETRHYVPLYIATTLIAKDPEKFGYNLDTIKYEKEYNYEIFRLDSAVNISALAEFAGISDEEFKNLNPELIRSATPPDISPYYIKIPYGSYDTFAEKFKDVEYADIHPFHIHSISRGETLSKIASKYGVSVQSIVQLNNMNSSRSILRIGQKLEIPVNPSRFYASSDKIEINPDEDVTHRVKRGESLYSIARRYGVNISDLRNYNNISYNDDKISVGQLLVIAKKSQPENEVKSEKEKSPTIEEINTSIVKHTVKRGETLGKIADDYSVTVSSIKSNNNLTSSRINPGQVLKITKTSNETFAQKETPSDNTKTVIHKVGRGETLSTIAALYGVTERALKSWNPTSIKGSTVYLGTSLKVETEEEAKGSSPAQSDEVKTAPIYYTVKSGDTLIGISRKFGVSVSSIQQSNPNLNPRRLRPGQKIRIK